MPNVEELFAPYPLDLRVRHIAEVLASLKGGCTRASVIAMARDGRLPRPTRLSKSTLLFDRDRVVKAVERLLTPEGAADDAA